MGSKPTLFFCIVLLFATALAEMRHFPGQTKMFSTERYYTPSKFLRHLEDDSVNAQIKTTNNTDTQLVTMRLKGDTELGYYYVTLFFGTPLQKQTLIVDTGSTTTTIPCQECGDNCGQHHFDKPFNHDQSKTFKKFQCREKFGDYVCNDCTSSECSFGVSYVEGSSYRGHFTRDYVSFGNEIEDYFSLLVDQDPEQLENDEEDQNREAQQDLLQNIVNQRRTLLPFGCTDKETKLFYDQEADGILGLGVNTNTRSSPPNLLDALPLKNSDFDRSFSLCLAPNGGYFTVGGYNTAYHTEKIFYTRYYEEYGQYRVYLNKIEVQGKDIGLKPAVLNHGEGAFFDSGTTLTHMPSENYNAIRSHITSFCAENADNCGKGSNSDKQPFCWARNTNDFPTQGEFFATFPTFKFYFGKESEAEYEWRAEDYLYKEEDNERYCLGLARYERETILGGTFMKNHDVLFDKDNKRLGFVRANCAAVNEISSLTPPGSEEPSQPTGTSPNTEEPSQPTGTSPNAEEPKPEPSEPTEPEPKTEEPKTEPSEPNGNVPETKVPTPDISSNKKGNDTDGTTFVITQADQWDQVKIGLIVLAVTAVVGGLIYAFIKKKKSKGYFKDIQQDVELQSGKHLGTSFEASLPETNNVQNKGATNTVESSGSSNSDVGIAI